jgi:carboxymethylenebutenolidase
VHYLDRTGESRVSYATLAERYPAWTATVADGVGWLATQPDVDPARLGLIGISLGAALALSTAAADRRIKAVVEYSGPLPQGLAESEPRLPATLILHGDDDRIVPVRNAVELEALLKRVGSPVESRIYPGQGHVLTGEAQFDSASRVAAFLDRYLKTA